MHRKWYVSGKGEDEILPSNTYRVTILSYGDPISSLFSQARMNHARMNQHRPSLTTQEPLRAGRPGLSSLLAVACALIFLLITPVLRAQAVIKQYPLCWVRPDFSPNNSRSARAGLGQDGDEPGGGESSAGRGRL